LLQDIRNYYKTITNKGLQFALDHQNFDWGRTNFVDESTFQTGHGVHTLVRRPYNNAYEERYIVPVRNSGRRSVSVFGVLHRGGLGPIVTIDGRFNAQQYEGVQCRCFTIY
jgi:hypothetical protein